CCTTHALRSCREHRLEHASQRAKRQRDDGTLDRSRCLVLASDLADGERLRPAKILTHPKSAVIYTTREIGRKVGGIAGLEWEARRQRTDRHARKAAQPAID